MPTQALSSKAALQDLFSIMRICKWGNKPHSNRCFGDFHYVSPSKELLPWDATANQLTTRESCYSHSIEWDRIIAQIEKAFYHPSDVDDHLYHIWGLNCERHYNFSLFSSSFQYIFTFLLHFPYIHQSSRNIYFNNIQNSFSSFFFLHVLKKLVPVHQDCPRQLMWLAEWPQKVVRKEFMCIANIQPSNHHDPSYLLFLPLSFFISFQFMHPHLFCLRRIQLFGCAQKPSCRNSKENKKCWPDIIWFLWINVLSTKSNYYLRWSVSIWFPRNQSGKTPK